MTSDPSSVAGYDASPPPRRPNGVRTAATMTERLIAPAYLPAPARPHARLPPTGVVGWLHRGRHGEARANRHARLCGSNCRGRFACREPVRPARRLGDVGLLPGSRSRSSSRTTTRRASPASRSTSSSSTTAYVVRVARHFARTRDAWRCSGSSSHARRNNARRSVASLTLVRLAGEERAARSDLRKLLTVIVGGAA